MTAMGRRPRARRWVLLLAASVALTGCGAGQTAGPDDATARCVDGTPSYSQNRSGTCSHHGGVAEWYKSQQQLDAENGGAADYDEPV